MGTNELTPQLALHQQIQGGHAVPRYHLVEELIAPNDHPVDRDQGAYKIAAMTVAHEQGSRDGR